MMVPAPRMPGTGNTGSAFVPDTFPSLANSRRTSRLHRLRQRLLRHRLYDCLDRVTTEFFYAYSVLAKPEYAFVPDVRLVPAKPWLHFVLDGSDCIDFGIDTLSTTASARLRHSPRALRACGYIDTGTRPRHRPRQSLARLPRPRLQHPRSRLPRHRHKGLPPRLRLTSLLSSPSIRDATPSTTLPL